MRIVVCIKEVLNPEIASSVFRVNEERKDVVALDGLSLVTSPFDEQAIEAALRIRDKHPCQITAVTFGPEGAKGAIKRAVSMGVDDGIHILDKGLERAESILAARVLSEAIRRLGQVDLILTGRQAADWDSGIVGSGIAQLLQWPIVTFAKSVELEGSELVVERVLDDGLETVQVVMPCVITISNELGEPRKASLRETMRAAKKPTKVETLSDIGIDGTALRADRERAQIRERLYMPCKEIDCEVVEAASAEEMAKQIVSRLAASKLI